ncbi:hypothetical protein Tco_0033133 [Tanacetum coccineum]
MYVVSCLRATDIGDTMVVECVLTSILTSGLCTVEMAWRYVMRAWRGYTIAGGGAAESGTDQNEGYESSGSYEYNGGYRINMGGQTQIMAWNHCTRTSLLTKRGRGGCQRTSIRGWRGGVVERHSEVHTQRSDGGVGVFTLELGVEWTSRRGTAADTRADVRGVDVLLNNGGYIGLRLMFADLGGLGGRRRYYGGLVEMGECWGLGGGGVGGGFVGECNLAMRMHCWLYKITRRSTSGSIQLLGDRRKLSTKRQESAAISIRKLNNCLVCTDEKELNFYQQAGNASFNAEYSKQLADEVDEIVVVT